jgi:hypothetical protein
LDVYRLLVLLEYSVSFCFLRIRPSRTPISRRPDVLPYTSPVPVPAVTRVITLRGVIRRRGNRLRDVIVLIEKLVIIYELIKRI